jgi:hypothetical protein
VAAVRCVVDSRSAVWQGKLTAFPLELRVVWASLDVLSLRFPGVAVVTIRPAQVASDSDRGLDFLGQGLPTF